MIPKNCLFLLTGCQNIKETQQTGKRRKLRNDIHNL